jgi:ferredoxin-NADP reductase
MQIVNSRNQAHYWETQPPIWRSDTDNALICCQIGQETHDVKSFSFRSVKPSLFRFLPGQFITLELNINGEQVNRSYTIASSPTQPDTLTLTIKRQPNGLVSNWMHDQLKVGDQISVLGPSGDFSCAHHKADKYLFLSGGSGITPLMSMSRAFSGLQERQDIAFVHSARTPSDIIFRQELDLMAARNVQFKPLYICANSDEDVNWSTPTGHINIELLNKCVPDFKSREVFTCGPAPYMEAIRDMLLKAGFDMHHYHQESFNFEELMSDAQTSEASANQDEANDTGSFRISLSKSIVTINCAANQFILDAARAAGLRMPSSCAKGLCGTCKTKMISGQVDMKHGGGIRQREIDQGMILPCCSKPLTDILLDR